MDLVWVSFPLYSLSLALYQTFLIGLWTSVVFYWHIFYLQNFLLDKKSFSHRKGIYCAWFGTIINVYKRREKNESFYMNAIFHTDRNKSHSSFYCCFCLPFLNIILVRSFPLRNKTFFLSFYSLPSNSVQCHWDFFIIIFPFYSSSLPIYKFIFLFRCRLSFHALFCDIMYVQSYL